MQKIRMPLTRKLALISVITLCISFTLTSTEKTTAMSITPDCCKYWVSKVDDEVKDIDSTTELDETSPQNIIKAIECFLMLEGNKHKAKFSGATHHEVSQIFELVTTDIAALYYISYLYHQKWDHADAIALRDDNGEINTPEIVQAAYKHYRAWFTQVKKVGLEKAREMRLDPLRGKDIQWYYA